MFIVLITGFYVYYAYFRYAKWFTFTNKQIFYFFLNVYVVYTFFMCYYIIMVTLYLKVHKYEIYK